MGWAAVVAAVLAAQGVGGGGMRRGVRACGREALPAALPLPLLAVPCPRGFGHFRPGHGPGCLW